MGVSEGGHHLGSGVGAVDVTVAAHDLALVGKTHHGGSVVFGLGAVLQLALGAIGKKRKLIFIK